jgi:hypothetical protein
MSDRTIVIDSADGNYLAANLSNIKILVSNSRDSRFPRNRRVGLQAARGQWLCSNPYQSGLLDATSPNRSGWETFELRDLGSNQAALLASTGKFVTAKSDGSQLVADSITVGLDQIFTVNYLPAGRVNLRCNNGLYVCANDGGGSYVVNNRTLLTITTLLNRSEGNGNTKTDRGAGMCVCGDGRQRKEGVVRYPT